MLRVFRFGVFPALLTACQPGGGESGVTADSARTFSAIDENETVRLLGNEPFWNAEVSGGSLTYATPDNTEGETIMVERFAGLGGLGYSGRLDGERFDVALNEEPCSDGMSDRTYPFAVVLKIGDDTRRGCGWTDARPFEGQANP